MFEGLQGLQFGKSSEGVGWEELQSVITEITVGRGGGGGMYTPIGGGGGTGGNLTCKRQFSEG